MGVAVAVHRVRAAGAHVPVSALPVVSAAREGEPAVQLQPGQDGARALVHLAQTG